MRLLENYIILATLEKLDRQFAVTRLLTDFEYNLVARGNCV